MTTGGWLGRGRGSCANQEITLYTGGFQQARHLAMSRLTEDIRKHGAEGAVGMDIDTDIEDIEYEVNNTTYHDLLAHFVAVGTAIVSEGQPIQTHVRSPLLMLNLNDGKSEQIKVNNLAD